ncbi:MAG: hypothetical protein K6F73_07850 [Lachnospiraceae bacterium]|nr:hypothetical protein [Lachnospiraceae bacterium]
MLMIILFAVAVLSGLRWSVDMYRESARQRSVVRSVQGIGRASSAIEKAVSSIARTAGQEQYEKLQELIMDDDDIRFSEKELEGYFRTGYANRIKSALGKDSHSVCTMLDSFIPEDERNTLSVADNPETHVYMEKDADGNTAALWIKNVTIRYDDPLIGERTDKISYSVRFPEAVFHAGNDDLFRYCMVAGKGIYIMGSTSSIIGDIYAGKHTAEECRDAELVYGETGTYGGINILSTQLGVKSDRIVSEGDININESFVVFSPEGGELCCYGQRMNEIEGLSKDATYTLDGTFYHTSKLEGEQFAEYRSIVNLVGLSLGNLKSIPIYYDSNNDGGYSEKYRKLISDSDIELTKDFTGIVATPGNVIVHKDVNFEGIILCGDRIYIRGNNNIVANAGVDRTIIASEDGAQGIIRVMDYIGGMKASGLKDPEYYVIPYR